MKLTEDNELVNAHSETSAEDVNSTTVLCDDKTSTSTEDISEV